MAPGVPMGSFGKRMNDNCFFMYILLLFISIVITVGLVVVMIIGTIGLFDSISAYCQVQSCNYSLNCMTIMLTANLTIDSVMWGFENTEKYCDRQCPLPEDMIDNKTSCIYSTSTQNVFLQRQSQTMFMFMFFPILISVLSMTCLIYRLLLIYSTPGMIN